MAYIGFKKLAAKTSPAIAASIGRKKYGKKKFQKAAKEGKTMENEKPLQEGGTVKRNPALNPDSKVLAKKRRKLEAIKKKNIRENNKKNNEPKWIKFLAEKGLAHPIAPATKRRGGIISKLQTGGTPYHKEKPTSTEKEVTKSHIKEGNLKSKTVKKTKNLPSGYSIVKTKVREQTNTPFRHKKRFKTKEVFKDGKYVQPYTGRFQTGGVAQGKSPGVDTPTTIDGTTYYQNGGKATSFEKDQIEKSFWEKQKAKQKEEKSNLDKISEGLKKANIQRQAIGTADDIKARKLKREQDKLKQEAESQIFKKGGKMKYKKGGIVSKLQTGGQGYVTKQDSVDKSRIKRGSEAASKRVGAQFVNERRKQIIELDKQIASSADPRKRVHLRKKRKYLVANLNREKQIQSNVHPARSKLYERDPSKAPKSDLSTIKSKQTGGAIEGGIKGGIIGKIKSKLKKKKTKKDEFEEISPYYSEIEQDLEKQGKAPATTKKRYGYSSPESEIEEDLRRGNRL